MALYDPKMPAVIAKSGHIDETGLNHDFPNSRRLIIRDFEKTGSNGAGRIQQPAA